MLSTRFAAPLLAASVAFSLVAVRDMRAGTLAQAVESALQGNGGKTDEETRKVQVGRHGFTVDVISVQNSAGTLVATGQIFHRHRIGKSDVIRYTITISGSSDPEIVVDVENRNWANKICKDIANGFKYVIRKFDPGTQLGAKIVDKTLGKIVSKVGGKIIDGNCLGFLQGNWVGASRTVINAIADRVQQDAGKSG